MFVSGTTSKLVVNGYDKINPNTEITLRAWLLIKSGLSVTQFKFKVLLYGTETTPSIDLTTYTTKIAVS